MTTIATFVFPAEEVILADTLRSLPNCEVLVEESAFGGDESALHVWIAHHDREQVTDALAADSSVDEYDVLKEIGGEFLVSLEHEQPILLPRRVIAQHEGAVLQAVASDDQWKLHTRFPARSDLSAVQDDFDRFDVTVCYESITESSALDREDDITDKQRQTLQKAVQMGYYEIPREVTIEDLAAELDVSHQSVSERLRRAQRNIVKRQLDGRMTPDSEAEVDIV